MEILVITLIVAALVAQILQVVLSMHRQGNTKSTPSKPISSETSVSTGKEYQEKWLKYVYSIPINQWDFEANRTFSDDKHPQKKPDGKAYIFQGTDQLIEIERWIPKNSTEYYPTNHIRFSGNGEESHLYISEGSQPEEFKKLNAFCQSIETYVFEKEDNRKFEAILT